MHKPAIAFCVSTTYDRLQTNGEHRADDNFIMHSHDTCDESIVSFLYGPSWGTPSAPQLCYLASCEAYNTVL